MLPDFATMLGGMRVTSPHPTLAAGIAFHHATDEVFHDSPTFVRLQAEGRHALADAGLGRGPRLATAHVGLELILDSELARDPEARNHYAAALESKAARSLGDLVEWSAPSEPHRYESLRRTLLARRDFVVPQTPGELFERLERVLKSRRALALSTADRTAVETWARDTWPEVRVALPQWVDELRTGLCLKRTQPAPRPSHQRFPSEYHERN